MSQYKVEKIKLGLNININIMKKNYKPVQNSNLVSVIMNCHNGEKYLAESIESESVDLIINRSYGTVRHVI